jgi:hypothetical protein
MKIKNRYKNFTEEKSRLVTIYSTYISVVITCFLASS